MPQRPPSNSARKNPALPNQPGDAAALLPAEDRRSIAPELLLDSGLTLEKYKLPIMLGVTVLVLSFVAWSYYESHAAGVAAAASAALDSAKTEADYQKVIATYPDSNAAANAYLLLGRAKYNASDYAGAAQAWGDFAAKFPHHSLVPDALTGKAGALEAQGKFDEARAMYQRVATSYQSSYAAPLARISEATLLLGQGKTDEAKHVYEDVMASSPKSSDASQIAEQGLKTLNALPPPGATPAPSVSPVPATVAAPVPAAVASPAALPPAAVQTPAPAAVSPPAAASPAPVASPVTIPAVTPSASVASPAIAPTATPSQTVTGPVMTPAATP